MSTETMIGHIVLGLIGLFTLLVLKRNGFKVDLHVWKNGNNKKDGQ